MQQVATQPPTLAATLRDLSRAKREHLAARARGDDRAAWEAASRVHQARLAVVLVQRFGARKLVGAGEA